MTTTPHKSLLWGASCGKDDIVDRQEKIQLDWKLMCFISSAGERVRCLEMPKKKKDTIVSKENSDTQKNLRRLLSLKMPMQQSRKR